MKAYLRTAVNPQGVEVYDSRDTSGAGLVRKILQPQISITTDDDITLYTWGQPPPDYRPHIVVAGLVILTAVLAIWKSGK